LLLNRIFDSSIIKLRFDTSKSRYTFENVLGNHEHDSGDLTVIHAGATTPKSQAELNIGSDYSLNTRGTTELLKILPKLPKRIIYLSTSDVYASTSNSINEATAPTHHNAYVRSKIACEELIQNYSQRLGCESIILRIGSVFGPNNVTYRKVIDVMIEDAILKGTIELLGTGHERRPFIFEQDLVSQIVQLQRIETLPKVINLVGEMDRTVNQVLEGILKRFPKTRVQRSLNLAFRESPFDQRTFDRTVFWKTLPDFVFSDFEESIGRTIDARLAKHNPRF
jgi:nucleoside-diphosphate-sugar epimerase